MATLHIVATDIGEQIGFAPMDVSARSMHVSGVMALLLAWVDADTIRLIGQWHNDEMLHYLHVTARPIMQDFVARMVMHGCYTLIPCLAATN